MKFLFEKKDIDRFLLNLLVVIAGISFYFLLNNFSDVSWAVHSFGKIMRPFVYGFAIAFLLNTPVMYFDELFEKVLTKSTSRRVVAILLTFLILSVVLTLLGVVMGPQLYDSGITLVLNIQRFVNGLDENTFEAIQQWFIEYNLPIDVYNQLENQWKELVGQASTILIAVIQYIINYTGTITSGVTNALVALVISVYLLMSKEYFFAQLRKVSYAILPKKNVERMFRVGNMISDTFNGFINGKIIDSIIMGLLIFICMTILRMPYVPLVSLICGLTNIIPFFGPFIGAVPSIFIIFIASPVKALEFLVLIVILQQVDGNIIGPKILGETTGLSAFWVLFAILVGGGLAGFVGMILGVPTFAVIYNLLSEYTNKRLEHKNLPTATETYENSEINPYEMNPTISDAMNDTMKKTVIHSNTEEGETNGEETGTAESDS